MNPYEFEPLQWSLQLPEQLVHPVHPLVHDDEQLPVHPVQPNVTTLSRVPSTITDALRPAPTNDNLRGVSHLLALIGTSSCSRNVLDKVEINSAVATAGSPGSPCKPGIPCIPLGPGSPGSPSRPSRPCTPCAPVSPLSCATTAVGNVDTFEKLAKAYAVADLPLSFCAFETTMSPLCNWVTSELRSPTNAIVPFFSGNTILNAADNTSDATPIVYAYPESLSSKTICCLDIMNPYFLTFNH